MKKIFYLIILMFTLNFVNVNASNDIYNISMDIYIDENANATITEKWDVKGNDGTEWFKRITNLGNSAITNYQVSMDGNPLKEKKWNINETLEEKRGYFGINYLDNGLELCFGKNDYNRHTFTFTYNVSNFIFNTNDSQILYWKLIDKLENVNFEKFNVKITSYYHFPDTLDVWGTGYNGLAYVYNGAIYLSNESKPNMTNDSYVVALAKFPLNTFNTNNSYSFYDSFNSVYNAFNEGTFKYDEKTMIEKILSILFPILSVVGIIALINYFAKKTGYGYKDNKKIKEKETPFFRDIPCNKNIFYANSLIKLNNFGYNATNIFGAVILKWVKENKITFQKSVKDGFFKDKEEYSLDLTSHPEFNTLEEQKIYDMMFEASIDGILDENEFKKWARLNSQKFIDVFNDVEKNEEKRLKNEGYIRKRINKQECKYGNVLEDTIYNDSKNLLGLKLFLKEFSEIDKRETIEVKIWDEYLMFAYLFGIADKVFSQLKKLYPEIIEQNIDNYNTVYMATRFNQTAIKSAIDAARSYSSGGGGFSTGGGGGGSFGGGGGGSR